MRRFILALGYILALGVPLAYGGWDGNGTFSRVHDWTDDRDAAINITASRMDAEDDSFAAGINNSLAKDGQNSPTAALPMAGFRHLNVGNATARNQYAAVGQVQDGSYTYATGTVSGGTAVTMSPSPSISAYATGMLFTFKASAAITGSATLDVDSVGVKTIKKYNDQNLASGDIESGQIVTVIYDGTNFQMINAPGTAVDSNTALLIANNLSDLGSAPTARTNLGFDGNSQVISGGDIANGTILLHDIASGTQGEVLYFDSTSSLAALGTASPGTFLQSNGAGADPSFGWGAVITRTVSYTTTASNTSTIIPNDGTLPQSNEGGEFLTVEFTPKHAGSTLMISVDFQFAADSGVTAVAAVFQDSGTGAICAKALPGAINSSIEVGGHMECYVAAGSTDTRTYRLRIGPSSANTLGVNATNTAAGEAFGGVAQMSLRVDEIAP